MRFAEQGFLLLYYGTSFSVGMVGTLKLCFCIQISDILFPAPHGDLLVLAQF